MSRSYPQKLKRRAAKESWLIFGEGPSDAAFLKHLRKLYSQNSGIRIDIRPGKGGSPKDIVEDAFRNSQGRDRVFVVLDCDKAPKEMVLARNHTQVKCGFIKLIENTPCLEYVLLNILNSKKVTPGKPSSEYKKAFEKDFIKDTDRCSPHAYERVFTKEIIDLARSRVPELGLLVTLSEGRYV